MNKQILKIFLCFCQLFVERVRNALIQSSHLYFLLEPSVPSVFFCLSVLLPSVLLSSLFFLSLFTRTPPLFLTTVRSVNYPLLTEDFSFLPRPIALCGGLIFPVEQMYLTSRLPHKTMLLLSPFTEVPQSPKATRPGSHSAKIQEAVKLVLLREFPWQRQSK